MGSLEKAARAAKAEIGRQLSARPLLGNADSGDWHATGDVQEIDLTLVARAVLLAVREPGPKALAAVFSAADDYPEVGPSGIWEAGIDAILEDKP
jgi:hypothetical protein